MTIDDFVDDVSDIRNHISPHTVVWDLASGEDFSVVESHELVESKGGLSEAKEYLNKKNILAWDALDGQLSQAVKDVEACHA